MSPVCDRGEGSSRVGTFLGLDYSDNSVNRDSVAIRLEVLIVFLFVFWKIDLAPGLNNEDLRLSRAVWSDVLCGKMSGGEWRAANKSPASRRSRLRFCDEKTYKRKQITPYVSCRYTGKGNPVDLGVYPRAYSNSNNNNRCRPTRTARDKHRGRCLGCEPQRS